MNFASDNWGPAHPAVLAALTEANAGYAPAYGGDPLTDRAIRLIREVFDAPDAQVVLVASGTATNALALSSLVRPWQSVLCSDLAHVHVDETGAVEHATGGAKLLPVATEGAKITPGTLSDALAAAGHYSMRPGALSLTNATERGTVYAPDEVAALAGLAKAAGLAVHMDGARFQNAVAATGAAPADLTWRAGVDALSLGGTKGGCLAAEAVVVFDPGRADGLIERRARAGHLLSKQRFVAAQYLAWLADGLWIDCAARANRQAARLGAGLSAAGVAPLFEVGANMVWAALPDEADARLREAGAHYHHMGEMAAGPLVRLVCDWSAEDEETDRFLALVEGRPRVDGPSSD